MAAMAKHNRRNPQGGRWTARKPDRRRAEADDGDDRPRLQKVLAAAGLGSRRECEELITSGRVEIDRQTVTRLGTRVDPANQEIRVDGEPLPRPKRQYFMLNKPTGVVSTARDPAGRPRVIDMVGTNQRLFPVGRLDLNSEGLILLTNDGEFANLLTHPRYEVEKTYLAQVAGMPSREDLGSLLKGVHLAEGYAHARRIRVKRQQKHSSILEIVLDEGRNREVRRLLARIGHKVMRLRRIAVGPLRLGNLAPGEYRPLRAEEVSALKEAALAAVRAGKKKVRRGPGETPQPAVEQVTKPRPLEAAAAESPWDDDASDRPVPEEALVTEFDERPTHTGTIIGDEDWDEADEADLGVQRDKTPARPTVQPILDVRRGIFPGRHGQEDEEEDDWDLSAQDWAGDEDEDAVQSASPRRAAGGERRRRERPGSRPPRAGERQRAQGASGRKPRKLRGTQRGERKLEPRGKRPAGEPRSGQAGQAKQRPVKRGADKSARAAKGQQRPPQRGKGAHAQMSGRGAGRRGRGRKGR